MSTKVQLNQIMCKPSNSGQNISKFTRVASCSSGFPIADRAAMGSSSVSINPYLGGLTVSILVIFTIGVVLVKAVHLRYCVSKKIKTQIIEHLADKYVS